MPSEMWPEDNSFRLIFCKEGQMAGRSDREILKKKGGRSPWCWSLGIWGCTVSVRFLLMSQHREVPGAGVWDSVVYRSRCSWQGASATYRIPWDVVSFFSIPVLPALGHYAPMLIDVLVFWIICLPCDWVFQKCHLVFVVCGIDPHLSCCCLLVPHATECSRLTNRPCRPQEKKWLVSLSPICSSSYFCLSSIPTS